MSEVEDDEKWSTIETLDEDEDSSRSECYQALSPGFRSIYRTHSNAIAGETALDRLANALGGKFILPHIIQLLPNMLMSSELLHHDSHVMVM